MARIARIVVPSYPHHINQRGNRRQQIFFNDGDYQTYIAEMNPVRAALVKTPGKWSWYSASAHISGQDDEFVNFRALLDIVKEDWKSFLLKGIDTETIEAFRKHERTGRPIGDDGFIEKVEKITGRRVKPR